VLKTATVVNIWFGFIYNEKRLNNLVKYVGLYLLNDDK
jgi:hypothetical protein